MGSSWADVQENLGRFQEHAARRGAHVSVTYCLMTRNWHEFADFCLMADARGLSCDVNTVTQPDDLSLYHLPVQELEVVVAGLEATERERGPDFGWSRPTWLGELDRLRRHLADRRAGSVVTGVDDHEESTVLVRPFARGRTRGAAAAAVVTAPEPWADDLDGLEVTELRFDDEGLITSVSAEAVLGLDPAVLVGRRGDDLLAVLAEHLAPVRAVETEQQVGDQRALRIDLEDDRTLLVRTVAVHDEHANRAGTTAYLAWAPSRDGHRARRLRGDVPGAVRVPPSRTHRRRPGLLCQRCVPPRVDRRHLAEGHLVGRALRPAASGHDRRRLHARLPGLRCAQGDRAASPDPGRGLRPLRRAAGVGWPKHIEFALSNTCNLQCVQCSGELSSAIRAQREHRPPLRSPYGDAFFDEIQEFLPAPRGGHLHRRRAVPHAGGPSGLGPAARAGRTRPRSGSRPTAPCGTTGSSTTSTV